VTSLLAWTPATFYALSAAVQTVTVFFIGRAMGVDREYFDPIPLAISLALGNTAAFFLRDLGVMGIIGICAAFIILLLAMTAVDTLVTLVSFLVVLGTYAGTVKLVTPRTPLTLEQIGGLPEVVVTGKIEAEPIKRESNDSVF